MSAAYIQNLAIRVCWNTQHMSAYVYRVSSVCQHLWNNYMTATYLTELATTTHNHSLQSKQQQLQWKMQKYKTKSFLENAVQL